MAHRIAFVATRQIGGGLLYSGGALVTTYPGDILSVTPANAAAATAVSTAFAVDQVQFTLTTPGSSAGTYQFNVTWDDGAGGTADATLIDVIGIPALSFVVGGECSFSPEWPTDAATAWTGLDLIPDGGTPIGGTSPTLHHTAGGTGDSSFAGSVVPTTTPAEGGQFGGTVSVAYRLHNLVGQGSNPLTRLDVFPSPITTLCGDGVDATLPGTPTVASPGGLDLDAQLRPSSAPTAPGDQPLGFTVNNGGDFAGTTTTFPRSGITAPDVRLIEFDTDGTVAMSEQVPATDITNVPPSQRDFPTSDGTYTWALGAGGATEISIDLANTTPSNLVITWTAALAPVTFGIEVIGTPVDTGRPIAAGAASVEGLPSTHSFALTLSPNSITIDSAASVAMSVTESPGFVDGESIELTLLSGHPDLSFSGSPANTLSGTALTGNDGLFPIQVEVAVFDSTGELVEIGTASADLTVNPAVVVSDPLAVAVVLDRSGSMSSSNRWLSARSAAHCFGDLLVDDDDGHHYGLYWFSGATSTSVDNADPAQLGSSFGTVTGLDMVAVDSSTPLSASAGSPGGYTSVGAGLLHARDRILASAPIGARRAVLVLSDGIENRQPSMARVFTNGDEPGIDNIPAGTTTPWLEGGNPDIDVYAVAMATTAAWHDRLVDRIGSLGQPADHVTTLDKATPSIDLHTWFLARFSELAGLTECDVPIDPTLTGVEGAAEHPALVSTNHSRLIFHLVVEDDADDWRIGLRPPDRANGAPEDTIVGSMPGISFRKGPLYHVVTVDFPVAAPGFEHHWAGQWTLEVERTADGEGNYAVSAIVKGDVHPSFGVLRPARPRTGDEVVLRAVLRDRGRPIRGAKVAAAVTPLPYIDDALARLTNGGSLDPSGEDVRTPEDKVLADAAKEGRTIEVETPGGTQQDVTFEEVAPGVYDGSFIADAPGLWDLHGSFDGTIDGRPPSKKLLGARAKLQKLRHHFPAAAFLAEARLADLRLYTPKPFHYERRKNVLVRFVPDWIRTRALARLWLGKGGPRLRISVRPVDRDGRLLGPGWGHAIQFGLPGVPFAPTIQDGGEGTYFVDAKLGGRGLSIDRFRRVVAGPSLQLGERSLATGRLDLRYLQAKVLQRGAILPVRFAVAKSLEAEPVFMHDLFSELADSAKKVRVKGGRFAEAHGRKGSQLQRSLAVASDSRLPATQRAHALRTARQLAAELAQASETEAERRFAAALYGAVAEVEANGWAPDGAATILVGAQSVGRIALSRIDELTTIGEKETRPRAAKPKKKSKAKATKKKAKATKKASKKATKAKKKKS